MKIHTEILGNLSAPEWREQARQARIDYVELDQWTAQKSRFVAATDAGEECAVALKRHTQLLDGDILEYDPDRRHILAVRIRLNDVLVADLGALTAESPETMLRTAMELGHAVGNQHWPAVIKGTKAYIPLTVDRKVMESVMRTHRLEGVVVSFQPGAEIIPYLAPHEIRRLFGTGPDSHVHSHHDTGCGCEHGHDHGHDTGCGCDHEHDHGHDTGCGCEHEHDHDHEHDCACPHRHEHAHEHLHADGTRHAHPHTH